MAHARTMTAAAAAMTVMTAAAVAQDELVFPLEEAPQAALEAARAAAPDVTFEAVDVEIEDGVITLEFSGARADGEKVEVDVAVAEDAAITWAVLEVETVIALDAVPAAVLEALEIAMGDFAPTSVERSARGDATIYEFEGVDAEGMAIDIEIEAEGDSVVVLDDDDT